MRITLDQLNAWIMAIANGTPLAKPAKRRKAKIVKRRPWSKISKMPEMRRKTILARVEAGESYSKMAREYGLFPMQVRDFCLANGVRSSVPRGNAGHGR